jgi:hypothetical protein
MIPSFWRLVLRSSSGAEALQHLHGTWSDLERKAKLQTVAFSRVRPSFLLRESLILVFNESGAVILVNDGT